MMIAELFDNERVAQKAVAELNKCNLGEDGVWVITRPEAAWPGGLESNPEERLLDLGLPAEEARFYKEGIKRGGQVVVVRTSAERAAEVWNILRQAQINEANP